ncbi:MAG: nicotinamide riboside transporter PnuC [Paludibacteraceae bacterium]|nr:nicotinamide riboside transporter PnuC [Paludibacteraceae bacterium]
MLTRIKNNIFVALFLTIGISIQLIAYYLVPDRPISLISGILGICSVVLCSVGNISTFIFGFAQIATYLYICYLNQLYGNLAINVFYFIAQIYGLYVWRKRGSSLNSSLITRHLSALKLIILTVIMIVASVLVGFVLQRFTDDPQPYLDAFTTVPAVVAEILMVLAYREQWFIWFLIDATYVVLWARTGNACMLLQFAFWCINCVYGFIRWNQALEIRNRHSEDIG